MASLSLRNIWKVYPGDVTAVKDFNLEIEDKEFVVLVGPSGCGKSTTLRMVAGLEEITKGELYIDGKLVNNVLPKDRDIAMVFQSYALYPHMTVYNNMAFALKLRKTPKAESTAACARRRRSRHRAPASTASPPRFPRPAPARGPGPRHRARAEGVFDGRASVQPGRQAARADAHGDHQAPQAPADHLHLRHPRPDRAMTMGTAHRIDEGRRHAAERHAPEPLRLPGEPLRAGFIGTPQMNIFRVKLEKQIDGVYAVFGENRVKVPAGKLQRFTSDSYIGREVYMGVRPENIHDEQGVPRRLAGQHHRRFRGDRRTDGFGNVPLPLHLWQVRQHHRPRRSALPRPAPATRSPWRWTPTACTSLISKRKRPF